MSKPAEQRKIIAILWLVPVFAVDSFISLLAKDASGVFELIKDIYEGYVVYVFFSLMVEYLGGEHRVVDLLEAFDFPIQRPWPFSLCIQQPFFPMHHRVSGFRFYKSCKIGVMQFVVLRPCVAILEAILNIANVYERGRVSVNDAYIWVEIIVNISVSWAVYCLWCFFLAFRVALADHDPVPKFLAVKSVVFLSFWQGVLLALLSDLKVVHEIGSWTVYDVSTGIQNLLICFEMLGAAVFHHWAFPYHEYAMHGYRINTTDSDAVGLGVQFTQLTETSKDFHQVFTSAGQQASYMIEGHSMELMPSSSSPPPPPSRDGDVPLLLKRDEI